jgi:histone demethylase JARID1
LDLRGAAWEIEARIKVHAVVLRRRSLNPFSPEPQYYSRNSPRTPSGRSKKLAATTNMHASPTSATPRGTPSRRGKSPLVGSHSPTGSASGSMPLPTDVSIKPTATFTTCLSIPVGSIPIESGDEPEISAQHSHSKNERAPRTSKTNALAALQTHAQSSSSGDADMYSQESDFRYINNDRHIPVSPILDMSSVKSTSPRHMPSGEKGRPFGLQDCPAFYPTVEEFKDPMAYVRSISGAAQNYGICKVIPPTGWKMPFMTDTEVSFSFQCDFFF